MLRGEEGDAWSCVLWEFMLLSLSPQPTNLWVWWRAHSGRFKLPILFWWDRLGSSHSGIVLAGCHWWVSTGENSYGLCTPLGYSSSVGIFPVLALVHTSERISKPSGWLFLELSRLWHLALEWAFWLITEPYHVSRLVIRWLLWIHVFVPGSFIVPNSSIFFSFSFFF